MMPKLGMKRALVIFGIAQGLTTLLFYMMAHIGPSYIGLVVTIAGENLAAGMGTAAYAAFLMSQCNQKFTATQYALLTSLMAVPTKILAAPTGYLQEAVGWPGFFIVATLTGVPALLMLVRFDKWSRVAPTKAEV